MSTVPPRIERRRARPGSVERPVNGRLYRGTWLLVGLPLLVAAFSVARPQPLPAPALEPSLEGDQIAAVAHDLAAIPNRSPGTYGAGQAAKWFRDQLGLSGLHVRGERFGATPAGSRSLHLENLIAVVPGHSPQTI